MEKARGTGVRMSDIAKATGISRQAVYLHFSTRTELLIATTHYVDQVKGLEQRLDSLKTARSSTELLELCVGIWGNYIPEIYGIAKALLTTRDTDEAADAAWKDVMGCLRIACKDIINTIKSQGCLSPDWKPKEASELLLALLSIQHWEQLTKETGWTQAQYIKRMKTLLIKTFIQN